MTDLKNTIKNKTKTLQAKWTVTLTTDQDPEHDPELEKEFGKILQEEIDWEVMCDVMKELGYTMITMDWPERMNEVRVHEIKEWCRKNLTDVFSGRGNTWLFKDEKDATLFILKWT